MKAVSTFLMTLLLIMSTLQDKYMWVNIVFACLMFANLLILEYKDNKEIKELKNALGAEEGKEKSSCGKNCSGKGCSGCGQTDTFFDNCNFKTVRPPQVRGKCLGYSLFGTYGEKEDKICECCKKCPNYYYYKEGSNIEE